MTKEIGGNVVITNVNKSVRKKTGATIKKIKDKNSQQIDEKNGAETLDPKTSFEALTTL